MKFSMTRPHPIFKPVSSTSSDQRPWMVIHDPSGDFCGRLFRSIDLERSPNWDNGTIFWNIRTGQVRVWRYGIFDKLIPQEQKKRKSCQSSS